MPLMMFLLSGTIIASFQQTVDIASIDVDGIFNGMVIDNNFKKL